MTADITASGAFNIWGAAAGAIVSTFIVIGFIMKYVALPWLEKNLVKPVGTVHKQLTVNHHSSDRPTVLDLIDDVRNDLNTAVERVRSDLSEVKDEVRVIRHTQDRVGTELKEHLEWSDDVKKTNSQEQIAMWNAIERIASAPASPPEKALEDHPEESNS